MPFRASNGLSKPRGVRGAPFETILVARRLPEKRGYPPSSPPRILISGCRRYLEVYFAARTCATPNLQPTAHSLGSLTHALQTEVVGASAIFYYLGADPDTVVSHSEAKLVGLKGYLNFDGFCLCVHGCVGECFPANPKDIVRHGAH
jgi:hypothetical protein